MYLAIKSYATFIVLVALVSIMLQCLLVSSADANVSSKWDSGFNGHVSVVTPANNYDNLHQVGQISFPAGTGSFRVKEVRNGRTTEQDTGASGASTDLNTTPFPKFVGNFGDPQRLTHRNNWGQWYRRRFDNDGCSGICFRILFVPNTNKINTGMREGESVTSTLTYNATGGGSASLAVAITKRGISHDWKSGVALNAAKDSAVFTYDSATSSYPTITADLNVVKSSGEHFIATLFQDLNGQRTSAPSNKSVADEGGDQYTKVPAGFSRADTRVYGEGWSGERNRFLAGVWFFDDKNLQVAFVPDPARMRKHMNSGDKLEMRVELFYRNSPNKTNLKATVTRNKLKLSIETTSATEVNKGGAAMFRISADDNPSESGIQNIKIKPSVSGHNFLVSTWGAKDVNKSQPVSDLTFTQSGGSGLYSTVYQVPTTGENNVFSGDGTITLALVAESADKYEIVSGKGSARVTVKDPDTAPTVGFDDNSLTKLVDEGDTASLEISMNGRTVENVTVRYTINTNSPYTADSGDYSDSNTGTTTIDSTTGNGTISIDITSDNNDSEAPETFQVVLNSTRMGSQTLMLVEDKKSSTVTINAASVWFSIANTNTGGEVDEGGTATFRISTNRDPVATGIQNITITPSVTGQNFLVSSWGTEDVNMPIPVSGFTQTGGTGPFSIVYSVPTSNQDDLFSGKGTIKLALVEPSDGSYLLDDRNDEAFVTVNNTTSAPKVQFVDNSLAKVVNEGNSVSLGISTTGGTRIAEDVSVRYTITPNTAGAADYRDPNNGVATIDSSTGNGVISIEIRNDSDNTEEDEDFQVALASARMGTLNLEIEQGKESSTVTIGVAAIAPQIEISTTNKRVPEGGSIRFTIQVSPEPQEKVTIPMKVVLAGDSSYLIYRAPSVAIVPSGEEFATYTITTADNSEVTGDVIIEVGMHDVSGYQVDQTPLEITIEDNDSKGSIYPAVSYSIVEQVIRSIILSDSKSSTEPQAHRTELTVPDVSISAVNSVVEEGSPAEFLIVSSEIVESSLSVRIELNGREGLIIGGHVRTAVIPSGQTSTSMTVNTQDNGVAEQDAKLTATLLEDSNYGFSDLNSTIVTVLDEADRGLRRQGLSEANRTILPRVLTAMRSESMRTTAEHLTLSMNDEMESGVSLGGRNSFDDLIVTGGETLNGNLESIKSEIGNSSFVLNLFSEEGLSSPATIWGQSKEQGLSGSEIAYGQSFQGDMFSRQIGITARTGNGIVAGFSTDVSESEVKYDSGSENISGINYSAKMNGIHPYFGYTSPDESARIHIVTGYGMGEIGVEQDGYAVEYLDSNFISGSIGGIRHLRQSSSEYGSFGGELNLMGDAWIIHQSVNSNDEFIPGFQSKAARIRIATEVRQQLPLSSFGTIAPSAKAAVRGGSLDSDSVFGFELSGGLDFNSSIGTVFMNSGRVFLSPDVPESQWELKSNLSYDQGSDGIGLLLNLSSVLGKMETDISDSFRNDYPLMDNFVSESTNHENTISLDSEIAYGINIWESSNLLKPFIRYSTDDFLQHEFSVGNQLNIAQEFQIELVGKRISSENTTPEDAVNLFGILNW